MVLTERVRFDLKGWVLIERMGFKRKVLSWKVMPPPPPSPFPGGPRAGALGVESNGAHRGGGSGRGRRREEEDEGNGEDMSGGGVGVARERIRNSPM